MSARDELRFARTLTAASSRQRALAEGRYQTAIGGVDFANGETARDRIVALNHCAATTQPVTPSRCVAYDGCDAGEPVVWCPVQGEAHVIPSFAPAAIATFFAQF